MNDTTPAPGPMRLAVTCGDPAGIGLEVALRSLVAARLTERVRVLVYAAPLHFEEELVRLQPAIVQRLALAARVTDAAEVAAGPGLTLVCLEGPPSPPPPGVYDPAWGAVARDALERAASDAVQGKVDAVMTAPISKRVLQSGGEPFPGQTELFAARSGARRHAMMLAGPVLRVVPVTGHVPLRDVPGLLTQELVLDAILAAHDALRLDFGIERPRISVTGLNPHAGEGGILGSEDREIIGPAIARAAALGVRVDGPHAADTWFHFAASGACDAVVCMYHDQALIPLKLLHFDQAVNVTVGLPIVRTSPDHGTAYDLAGTGRARTSSTVAALELAVSIAEARRSAGGSPRGGGIRADGP